MLHPRINLLESLHQYVMNISQLSPFATLIADAKDLLFGQIQQFPRRRALLVGVLHNLGPGVDQGPQDRFFVDDTSVVGRIGCRGHRMRDFGQGRGPPDFLKVPGRLEAVDQQRQIQLLARLVQIDHVLVQHSVSIVVEVLGLENQRNFVADFRQQEHAAQRVPFGLQIAGWLPVQQRQARGLRLTLDSAGRGHESAPPCGLTMVTFEPGKPGAAGTS